jgi:erythrin-vacuolar iron transport family protein
MATIISAARRQRDQRSFLLQRAQPAMVGLIDGSLSTLAPIFAVAFATHQPRYAFLAGLATAIGAGVSMAFSEGLSDTGDLTGRGRSYLRGAITGAGTFLGGILHTLPFLIPQYRSAVLLALAVIAFELLALAWIRRRFFGTGFLSSLVSVTLGGVIIATISAALGAVRLRAPLGPVHLHIRVRVGGVVRVPGHPREGDDPGPTGRHAGRMRESADRPGAAILFMKLSSRDLV